MLSSDPRLVRQKANLDSFLHENREKMELMQYEVWTVRTSHFHEPVRLAPSELLPGIVGVFPALGSKCAPRSVVALYPGALMWTEMHQQFADQFHCPTAVLATVLDYTVKDASVALAMGLTQTDSKGDWLVKMVLVGDPTNVGSIFNSPMGLDVQPNCELRSCRPDELHMYKKKTRKTGSKWTINAALIAVRRRQEVEDVSEQTELMFCYDSLDADASCGSRSQRVSMPAARDSDDDSGDEENFWRHLRKNEFCERCFGRVAVAPDVFVQCSHQSDPESKKFDCSVIRHQSCFGRVLQQHEQWFCPSHARGQPLDAPPLDMFDLTGPSPTRESKPAAALEDAWLLDMMEPSPLRQDKPSLSSLITSAPLHQPPLPSRIASATPAGHSIIPDDELASLIQATPASTALFTPPPRRVAPLSLAARLTQSAAPALARLSAPTPSVPRPALLFLQEAQESIAESEDDEAVPICLDLREDENGSDSSCSASSKDEASSSESERDEDDGASAMLKTKRTSSFVPLQVKLLSQRPVGDTIVTLSEQGKEKLRMVWSDFIADIDRHAGRRRPKWVIRPEHANSSKETKSFDKLLRQFRHVTQCCATPEKLRLHHSHGQATSPCQFFQDCCTFLRGQLEIKQQVEYKKKMLDAALRSMQMAPAPWAWHGYLLCASCTCDARDVSRSKMYECRVRNHKRKHRKAGKTTIAVKKLLMQKVNGECQFLPNREQLKGANGQPLEIRVLPYRSQGACIQALQVLANQIGCIDTIPIQITRSTFQRAVELVARDHNIALNLKSCKSLAACSICTELQGAISKARIAYQASPFFSAQLKEEVDLAHQAFENHTEEWKEQREYFSEKKNLALKCPWRQWVITYDGMDTNKTQLPHTVRQHKEMSQLALRVVGAFCYGAPILCIGLMSFDDVPTKGGSASVTAVERMLDMQFLAMDTSTYDPIPGEDAFNAQLLLDQQARAALAVPMEIDESPDKTWTNCVGELKSKVGFSWPEVCHFTFDNTASDSKNAHTFRFFAALVMLGVFMAVTVSCLMVGHTHDIVDQMFSVWSQLLNIHDAMTLSKMRKIFREQYGSRIYELKEMLDKMAAAAGPPPAGKKHEFEEHALPAVAQRLQEIAKLLGVKPEIVLQEMVIDADSWCYKSIPNITTPHVFRLQKELVDDDMSPPHKVEVVAMYTRFLARSHEDSTVHHNPKWKNLPGGPWTSRAVIMRYRAADDPLRDRDPLRQPIGDPYRHPPRKIEEDVIAGVNSYIKTLLQTPDFSQADEEEWHRLFDKFDSNFDELQATCAECAGFMQKLKSIGVIRRPTNPTAAQKAKADLQTEQKREANAGLRAHVMADPEKHQRTLGVAGWWTKWEQRVREVIRPYYIARKLIDPSHVPGGRDTKRLGRMVHPPALPSMPEDPPLRHSRVEESCKGSPQPGDLVLVRGGTPMDPIWVGEILSKEEADGILQSKGRGRSKSTKSIAKSSARHVPESESSESDASSDEDKEEEEEEEKDMQRGALSVRFAAASAAAPAAAASTRARRSAAITATARAAAILSACEVDDDTPLNVIAAASSSKKKSARASRVEADDSDFEAQLSEDDAIHRAAPAAAAASSMRSSSSSAAAAAAAAAAAQSASSKRSCSSTAPSRGSGKRSGGSQTAAPSGRRTHKATADTDQDSNTIYHIRYYMYVSDPKKLLGSADDWIEKMTAAGPDALRVWNDAVESFAKGVYTCLPLAAVNRFASLKYVLPAKVSVDTVARSQIYYWGPRKSVLTAKAKGSKGQRLTQAVWRKAVEDLCELKDREHGMSIDHSKDWD